jgi:hypothetical protein
LIRTRQTVLSTILNIILVIAGQIALASDHVQEIKIDDNKVLIITKIASSRLLPHAYYDQATASIPVLYPEYQFFAKRRFGYLGNMAYSIVCYKKTKDDINVIITGTAVMNADAWSFQTEVPDTSFGDMLILVLETIEKLPESISE